jgi:hypothetical protein
MPVRCLLSSLILVLFIGAPCLGQAPTSADQGDALVRRALASEMRATKDAQHPMRYRLQKSSPRLTSTKEIFETKDGDVARLISVNNAPLSQADEQKEQARLDQLLSDPSLQRHRKQAEDVDQARAMKVLHALPEAFVYQFAGIGNGLTGKVAKFTFKANPHFDPPDLESQVLTQMTGEIWIDVSQERVARLECHLQQDVDFGWGILGRLDKGGWIVIEQVDVGDHQWRIVHFKMGMSGRVFFKNKDFSTTEDESQFEPVAANLTYQQAIQMLRTTQTSAGHGSR